MGGTVCKQDDHPLQEVIPTATYLQEVILTTTGRKDPGELATASTASGFTRNQI
jgi:hypothetical protein